MKTANTKPPFSTKRSLKLLGELFTREYDGGVVKYLPKLGMASRCSEEWIVHGVCPSCHVRAITCGRCVQCGWES
jgi:hypothetical protein